MNEVIKNVGIEKPTTVDPTIAGTSETNLGEVEKLAGLSSTGEIKPLKPKGKGKPKPTESTPAKQVADPKVTGKPKPKPTPTVELEVDNTHRNFIGEMETAVTMWHKKISKAVLTAISVDRKPLIEDVTEIESYKKLDRAAKDAAQAESKTKLAFLDKVEAIVKTSGVKFHKDFCGILAAKKMESPETYAAQNFCFTVEAFREFEKFVGETKATTEKLVEIATAFYGVPEFETLDITEIGHLYNTFPSIPVSKDENLFGVLNARIAATVESMFPGFLGNYKPVVSASTVVRSATGKTNQVGEYHLVGKIGTEKVDVHLVVGGGRGQGDGAKLSDIVRKQIEKAGKTVTPTSAPFMAATLENGQKVMKAFARWEAGKEIPVKVQTYNSLVRNEPAGDNIWSGYLAGSKGISYMGANIGSESNRIIAALKLNGVSFDLTVGDTKVTG